MQYNARWETEELRTMLHESVVAYNARSGGCRKILERRPWSALHAVTSHPHAIIPFNNIYNPGVVALNVPRRVRFPRVLQRSKSLNVPECARMCLNVPWLCC